MIRQIEVGNFKAFGERQVVELKPITLVYGPNSAGKSSVLHALALVHEADRGGGFDVTLPEVGGSSIDLGGFEQYVHRRDAKKEVLLGLSVGLSEVLPEALGRRVSDEDEVSFSVSIGIDVDDRGRPAPGAKPKVRSAELGACGLALAKMSLREDGKMALDDLSMTHPLMDWLLEEAEDRGAAGLALLATKALPALWIGLGNIWPETVAVHPGVAEDEGVRTLRSGLTDLFERLAGALHTNLQTLRYLGPLRSFPPRRMFEGSEDRNWIAGGGEAWDRMRKDDALRERVNAWLSAPDRLRTRYRVEVRRYVPESALTTFAQNALRDTLDRARTFLEENAGGELPESTALRTWMDSFDETHEAEEFQRAFTARDVGQFTSSPFLIDLRTNTEVSHRDVGIGVSQVLPVLVSTFGLEQKLVAIEQPEIHLHPALQAELGDVFAESMRERGNTFLIETHSEHLLLRLLRRIRETTERREQGETSKDDLLPEQVGVYYVRPEESGATEVRRLRIDERGDFLDRWPDGFFAERAKELF